MAVIDSGIDYTHPDFCKEDGTTRIAALWDQTLDAAVLNEAKTEQNEQITYAPVSYTHLDVYKRQAIYRYREFLPVLRKYLFWDICNRWGCGCKIRAWNGM